MMTSEVQTYADIGGISVPDLNLAALLRLSVCPKFMHDVGYTSWRRKIGTVNANAQAVALPTDCDMIEGVYKGAPTASNPPLIYIGENPDSVMAAEGSAPGVPSGYYFYPDGSGNPLGFIKFSCSPSPTFTATLVYYRKFTFADNTTDVDLNLWVPSQYQWALVEKLKAEIYKIRSGIGDPGYIVAEQEYKIFVERATDNKEQARRNNPVFAR